MTGSEACIIFGVLASSKCTVAYILTVMGEHCLPILGMGQGVEGLNESCKGEVGYW